MLSDKTLSVLLLGPAQCGKSALVETFLRRQQPNLSDYNPTIEDNFTIQHRYKNIAYLLSIHEVGGTFDVLLSSRILSCDCFVLVYDVGSKASFLHVYEYYKKIIELKRKSEIPIILVGSKIDSVSSTLLPANIPQETVQAMLNGKRRREVTADMGKGLADSMGVPFCEATAKAPFCVASVFEQVLTRAIDMHLYRLSSDSLLRPQRQTELHRNVSDSTTSSNTLSSPAWPSRKIQWMRSFEKFQNETYEAGTLEYKDSACYVIPENVPKTSILNKRDEIWESANGKEIPLASGDVDKALSETMSSSDTMLLKAFVEQGFKERAESITSIVAKPSLRTTRSFSINSKKTISTPTSPTDALPPALPTIEQPADTVKAPSENPSIRPPSLESLGMSDGSAVAVAERLPIPGETTPASSKPQTPDLADIEKDSAAIFDFAETAKEIEHEEEEDARIVPSEPPTPGSESPLETGEATLRANSTASIAVADPFELAQQLDQIMSELSVLSARSQSMHLNESKDADTTSSNESDSDDTLDSVPDYLQFLPSPVTLPPPPIRKVR